MDKPTIRKSFKSYLGKKEILGITIGVLILALSNYKADIQTSLIFIIALIAVVVFLDFVFNKINYWQNLEKVNQELEKKLSEKSNEKVEEQEWEVPEYLKQAQKMAETTQKSMELLGFKKKKKVK